MSVRTRRARGASPVFRALLAGIDLYLPNTLPNGATYASLWGCVNDVSRVEAMLEARVTLPREITKLLARHPVLGELAAPESTSPTYANLRAALDKLVADARPGDRVLIYYSGHGGRVLTSVPDLKPDGYDETLVPMDIGAASTPYLRDLDIAYYLDALTTKTRTPVTIVLDSCHSGGATRGADVAARCASGARPGVDPSLDTTVRPTAGVASEDELRAAWKRLAGTGSGRRAAVATTWLPESSGYVLLAACRDVELALEASIEGAPRGGVMTAAFLDAVERLGTDQTWKVLYERVLPCVHSRYPSQTPQMLGKSELQVLGVTLRPVVHTVTVVDIDAPNRRVKLRAGQMTGTAAGSIFGIYRAGTTDFTQVDKRVGAAVVTEVAATESWATVEKSAPITAIEPGAPALLEDVGSVALRRAVNLFHRNDLPPGIDQERALAAVGAAIKAKGRGFLELSTNGTPSYQVAVDGGGRYEIWDPSGERMPNVGGVDIGAPGAAERVVERLVHIFRYQTILGIDEPSARLEGALRVELRAPPLGWSPGQPILGGTVIERSGDAYVAKPGTYLFVRVMNGGSHPINIVAMDLDDDWAIGALEPSDPSMGSYVTVDAGKDDWFAFRAVLRAGRASALDVIKIFATVDDTDFWWLLQPPLDHTRTPTFTSPRDALFRLHEALEAEHNERTGLPAFGLGSDWAVRQLRVVTRP